MTSRLLGHNPVRTAAGALLLALAALALPAGPSEAGGRGRVNPAWLEVQDLAQSVRHAPQATPADLDALAQRMTPLAAEQRRLITEALALDAEEEWLVETNRSVNEQKAAFERACSEIVDDAQLSRCQALVDEINARVDHFNDRYLRFVPREERYSRDVQVWLKGLEEARTWMRGVLARRVLTPDERALLGQERERLRRDVDGLQEALRRLQAQQGTEEEERADWEARYKDARARAQERLRGYLADRSLEAAQDLLSACSDRLTKTIRSKLDERINVAGGTAADKAERVKALDEEIRRLVKDRAEVDSAGPALGRAWSAVKDASGALDAADDGSAAKVIEQLADTVGDVLGDPAVQRALRLSEAPANVYTYGKLIADAAFDITTELLALRRVGQLDRNADAYLAAVARLDEQMKKKVARIAEINRQLESR